MRSLIHSIVFKITLTYSSLLKYGCIQCTCTHLAKYNFDTNLEYNIPQSSAVHQCVCPYPWAFLLQSMNVMATVIFML